MGSPVKAVNSQITLVHEYESIRPPPTVKAINAEMHTTAAATHGDRQLTWQIENMADLI